MTYKKPVRNRVTAKKPKFDVIAVKIAQTNVRNNVGCIIRLRPSVSAK